MICELIRDWQQGLRITRCHLISRNIFIAVSQIVPLRAIVTGRQRLCRLPQWLYRSLDLLSFLNLRQA